MVIEVTGSAPTSRAKNRRTTRVWSRVLEILLLAIAGFSLVLLLTQDLALVTKWLLSPPAVILVVVVFIEYLIIKGGDRSRLYLIELDRMHEREQAQVARTRKALQELERVIEQYPEAAATDAAGEDSGSGPPDLAASLRRVDKILRPDLEG